ncbi:PilW family protein [Motilimonas pumila]|uniref:Prepilin-type N-terminal cleavage/methylation domain-containing protein n=1 Tax=Motilimonas pumila TaxID=2303987 RepID=A0A418YG79_9GAMM|nr:prepilin-type N-terminal cleavage/methylation domain-containing protein [Motilimonas pumila]RJG48477.1 prepilin-type N-terminal cleavage/methylation domain-containing protein [Motilimonas pumila]
MNLNIRKAQSGFTLIELMVSMAIGLTLVLACSSVYSSLKTAVTLTQQMSEAQESLRASFNLIARSVRQAGGLAKETMDGKDRLRTTYDNIQTGDVVYSCLGNTRSNGTSDLFYLGDEGLYCNDGIGNQLIALSVEKMTVTPLGSNGVTVQLYIDGMPASYGSDGIAFTLAQRQKILDQNSN